MEISAIYLPTSYAYLDRDINRDTDLLLNRSNRGKTVRFLHSPFFVVATIYITGHPFRRRSRRGESDLRRNSRFAPPVQVRKENPFDRLDNYSIMNSVRQCCIRQSSAITVTLYASTRRKWRTWLGMDSKQSRTVGHHAKLARWHDSPWENHCDRGETTRSEL